MIECYEKDCFYHCKEGPWCDEDECRRFRPLPEESKKLYVYKEGDEIETKIIAA